MKKQNVVNRLAVTLLAVCVYAREHIPFGIRI